MVEKYLLRASFCLVVMTSFAGDEWKLDSSSWKSSFLTTIGCSGDPAMESPLDVDMAHHPGLEKK
jgi:hypothetical protein